MIDFERQTDSRPLSASQCQTVLMKTRNWFSTRLMLIGAMVFLLMFSGVAGTRWIRDQNAINIVSRLTELQREELKQNHVYFQKLSSAEHAQLRELHEFVMEDPSLEQTVEAYEQWIESISPFDRAALKEKTEAADRLVLTRSLINEELDRKLKSPLERMREKGPLMNTEDIQSLVSSMEPKLKTKQVEMVSKLSEGKRAIDTIAYYIDNESSSLAQFRDSLKRKENFNQLLSCLKDDRLKQKLQQQKESNKVSEFGKSLVRGLITMRFQELYESTNISNEMLVLEFNKLDPKSMTEFFEQPAEVQKLRLRMMYLMQNTRWEETPFGDKNLEMIASAFGLNPREYLFRRGGYRGAGGPPGGPGGPDRGPDRGPDGERDGRDGRDGRGGGGFFNRRDDRQGPPNGPPPGPPPGEESEDRPNFSRFRERFNNEKNR